MLSILFKRRPPPTSSSGPTAAAESGGIGVTFGNDSPCQLDFEFANLILRNAAACPAVPTLFAVSPGRSA